MANEEIKRHLVDYMNEHFSGPGPDEGLLAGETITNPEHLAYDARIGQAYGMAQELLTPDGEQLCWDDEGRCYIGPYVE